MRTWAWTILGIGAILIAAPAQAQTYNPNYPVCIQTYGRTGNYIDCRYESISQCQMTAFGLAAQCYPNPYFMYKTPWKRHRN